MVEDTKKSSGTFSLVPNPADAPMIERLWKEFLKTRDISLSRLEAVDAATQVCEKGTLAKYARLVASASMGCITDGDDTTGVPHG